MRSHNLPRCGCGRMGHPALLLSAVLSRRAGFWGICAVLRSNMALLRNFTTRNSFGFLSRIYVLRLSILFSRKVGKGGGG